MTVADSANDNYVYINVPFAYQAPLSGVEDKSFHKIMWYSKYITFTKKDDERVLLHLEGADYISRLWVNGIYIGEHIGGYNRATFDITNAVKDNEEALVVIRIEDDKACTKPHDIYEDPLYHPFVKGGRYNG